MSSLIEFRRLFEEWKTRIERAKKIINPTPWTEEDWRQFSQGLILLVMKNGETWPSDHKTKYWDLRWKTKDGGELVCQIELFEDNARSLIVAQVGGFAASVGSYTWLWVELDEEGHFRRDPYFVDGTWKEALLTLLIPLKHQAGFYLEQMVTRSGNLLKNKETPRPDIDAGTAPSTKSTAHTKQEAVEIG
jgi:hypothetical protein